MIILFFFIGFAIGRFGDKYGGHLNLPHHWIYGLSLIILGFIINNHHIVYADNYEYYAKVFNFSAAQFRNDMVFSIVAHMLPVHQFAQHMWMVGSDCDLIAADHSGLKFKYNNSVMRIDNDIHVLDKSILVDDRKLELLQSWSKLQ